MRISLSLEYVGRSMRLKHVCEMGKIDCDFWVLARQNGELLPSYDVRPCAGGREGGGVERVALEERMKPRGGRTKRRIHEIQTDLEAANRDARRAGGKLQQARLLLLRHLLHG